MIYISFFGWDRRDDGTLYNTDMLDWIKDNATKCKFITANINYSGTKKYIVGVELDSECALALKLKFGIR